MRISQRLQDVRPSITLAITARAQALSRSGVDVVAFGAGEPDFDTPPHIKEAAAAAIERGVASKYTPVAGLRELRAAVAEDLSRAHRVPFAAEQILISAGAKHSLWNTMMALLDPGDEVIVPVPTWPSHIEIIRMAGGVPRFLHTRTEDGFAIDMERLQRLVSPRTRAILLCSPGNPTGAVYAAETLHRIAELMTARADPDLFIITDDLYRRLVYRPSEWSSVLHGAPELADRVIIIDGVSKAYAMTGWRIGFCAAPRPLVDAMQTLQGQVTSNATAVAQYAALAALSGDQSPVDAMCLEFDRRRRLMHGALCSIPAVRCAEPQGAFYCLPDLRDYVGPQHGERGLPADDVELADWLLTHWNVAVVPGSGFFAPGHVRLSYALGPNEIGEGIRRLSDGLAQLRSA